MKKGITLITLVVTIIVMLLLVGVTLTITLGSDGVIEKSRASKLETRYGTIMDLIKVRENSLELNFAKNEIGESKEEFINRLLDKDLITSEDIYDDEDFNTISLGLKSDGSYTYIVHIVDGTLEGKRIFDATMELPDADKPGNEDLKNMILTVQINTNNESFKLPITGYQGLYVNWNFNDSNDNFQKITTAANLTNVYQNSGTYEVHIKGTAATNSTFGKDGILTYYENPQIVGLKSWGENGFSEIHSFGKNLKGNIPIPSRRSFENVTKFRGTFHSCNELEGKIPKNIFVTASKTEEFRDTFLGCNSLIGSIPENLLINTPNLKTIHGMFQNCSGLSGSIPLGIFDNIPQIDALDLVFYGCKNLTGKIPPNLFDKCKDITSISYTFTSCENLEGEIPSRLFAFNPEVKFFHGTFMGCKKLTKIYSTLFDNCNKVTDFGYTFFNCINLKGMAPELWNKEGQSGITSGCFRSCTNLDNYSLIPTSWR